MAIKHLTDEQVRTWTAEQKDRWWLENVYRGDMPQLTLRAALSGMIIGGILSTSNLFVGMKTGWTLGVGITSVILAFGAFKLMSRVGLAKEFTVLENNAMQSIATAAGYMTSPLISSLAAYMMFTGDPIPMGTTIAWMLAICLLGVLFAFPLKRRFINEEQYEFPEGKAAGVVMDALHTSGAGEGLFKAKLLAVFGAASALLEFWKDAEILEKLHAKALAFPGALEAWIYSLSGWTPRVRGVSLPELTVSLEPDFVMFGAGGLSGIRTGVSLLIGAVLNYVVIAPLIIQHGDIYGALGADGEMAFGFNRITKWALWGGVAMMTTASIFAFLSKPSAIIRAFSGLIGRGRRDGTEDCVRHIELPMGVFLLGIPIVGSAVVWLASKYFGVSVWMGVLAIPMVFVFTIIAAHSTALTSITPTGALGKLTQLTYATMSPSVTVNLITASITGEVAGNASNLLMDIKPGYMLGAKPRQQAMGHVLGILAGSLVAVPVFYFAFLQNNPAGLISEKFPMPAATIWRAVAELLTRGVSELPSTAVAAAAIGAIAGIVLEIIKGITRNRLPVSAVGLGLAFVISFQTCMAMAAGAIFFWAMGKLIRSERSILRRIFVDNLEPVCAGIIAGGSLMGVTLKIINVFWEG